MTTFIYIITALGIIGTVIYLSYGKIKALLQIDNNKNTNETETDFETEAVILILEPVLARIYDTTTHPRKIYNILLDSSTQKKIIAASTMGLGRQWYREGEKVYALCKKSADKYIPVEHYLTGERKNPPSKLYNHLNRPEIEITHDVKKDNSFMKQYGHYLPYGLAMAFIVFMMVAS